MNKKLKIYLKFGENKQTNSLLNELDKYSQLSTRITLNCEENLSFLGILKLISTSFKNINNVDEIIEQKVLIDKSDSNLKYTVHILNTNSKEVALVRNLEDGHKIWYGFKLIKTTNTASIFEYYEGWWIYSNSIKKTSPVNNALNKKNLKNKALIIENSINRTFK